MSFYFILNPTYTHTGIHTCQDHIILHLSKQNSCSAAEICRIINNIFLFPTFFPFDSMKDSLSITCSVLSLPEGARAQPLIILRMLNPVL